MARIVRFEGRNISVPDDATDDEVAQIIGGQAPSPSGGGLEGVVRKGMGLEAQKPSGIMGTAVDMARTVPGALASGFAAMAGLPGDLQQLIVGQKTPLGAPRTKEIMDTVSAPFGGMYEPKTTAGEYTQTIGSFAPAALSPGSALTRAARVVVPGAASETAGQLFKGDDLEPYARMGGALVGGIGLELARASARPLTRVANKAVEQIRGHGFLDPDAEAVRRLQSAINREGGVPAVNQRLNEWAQTDASNPALIDVTGGNVRRLVRAAAGGSEGNAQNVAQGYMNRVASGLQDEASRLTRGLPPTGTPINAGQYADDLTTMQGHMAQNEYRVPYSQPASVTPEMVDALQGPEGHGAIRLAYAVARANRDKQAMAELSDLRKVAAQQSGGRNIVTGKAQSLEQALSELSAGSLDRVRIAMRDTAMDLAQSPRTRGIARGLRARVGDIDTALDQTPGLTDARASYRQNQAMIDAVEHGRQGLSQPSSAYIPELQRLQGITPQSQIGAGVGYRQSLIDALERPAQGAVGPVARIGSAPQQSQNLAATFGADVAERYQAGMRNELQRVVNARGISPTTGSQTALRAEEMAVLDAMPFGQKAGMIARTIDMLKRGLSLTEAEKEAIVRLGTTEANLRRVLANAPARQSPLAIAQNILISGRLGAAP